MDNLKKHIQNNRSKMDVDIPDDFVWDNIQSTLFPEEKKETNTKVISLNIRKRIIWIAAACVIFIIGIFSWNLISNRENIKYENQSIAKKENDINTTPNVDSDINTTLAKDSNKSDNKAFVKNEITPKERIFPKTKEINKVPKSEKKSSILYAKAENVEVGEFTQLINYQKEIINTIPILGVKPSYFNDFKTQLTEMDQDEKSVRKDIAKGGINQVTINQLINIYQQKINVLKQLSDEINRTNKIYSQESHPKTSKIHYLNL